MTEDATDKLQGIEIIGQTTPLDEPTGFPNDLHVLHNLLEAKNKIIELQDSKIVSLEEQLRVLKQE